MRKKIEIKIDYDETSVSDNLELELKLSTEKHIHQGLLAPTGNEIVDHYQVDVL